MSDRTTGRGNGAATVAELAGRAAARFGDQLAARCKVAAEWQDKTFAEVGVAIDELALGLIELGIEQGDRVALLAGTRLEWTVASFAVSSIGAVVVPVYPTSSQPELEWLVGSSSARAVVCEDAYQVERVEYARGALPEVAHVIGIEPGSCALTIDELRASGRGRDRALLRARQEQVRPEDPYTIIYTSGTTGPPKGVVLTHANAIATCAIVEELSIIGPGELTYLYLPLAHVFALVAQLGSYDQGGAIVYFGGDTKQIMGEIALTRPTYLPSVPRIFEKLYALAMRLQEQGTEAEREHLREAVELGVEVQLARHRGEPVPAATLAKFEEVDAEIFARIRGLFGGRVRLAITGAAPIAPEILEFFYAAGVPVLEGWGMTETTAAGTLATLQQPRFGTVGLPVPGFQVQIDPDDGEILVTGPNVFSEYWRDLEATAEALHEGWLRTGDVGRLDDDGYLTITGRKKDIIITAGGLNLTPANIEHDLRRSPFISEVVMYGDRRPYAVAMITLDAEEIAPWARERDLPEDVAALAQAQAVVELIQGELDRVNADYASAEQIKRFTILEHELSIEDGELTPTLKVKRSVVAERYADRFEALYASDQ